MASRKVTIELIVDGKGAVKGVKQVDGAVKKFDDTLGKTGKTAGRFKKVFGQAFAFASVAAATAALKSFARFVRESLNLTKTQEIAERKLAAALKNSGEEIENNAKALIKQAGALQKVSNFGDEVIINAQAFLLTVQESAGPQGIALLTPRLLDMASAIAKTAGEQVDLMTVTRAVGRALGGEVGGLSRYGVFLSDVEEAALKAASGIERVQIVTELLDKRFAGLAAATKDPFVQLQNAIGDLQEEFARGLLPIIEEVVSEFVDLASSTEVQDWARSVGASMGKMIEDGFQWFVDNKELIDFLTDELANGLEAIAREGRKLVAIALAIQSVAEAWDDATSALARYITGSAALTDPAAGGFQTGPGAGTPPPAGAGGLSFLPTFRGTPAARTGGGGGGESGGGKTFDELHPLLKADTAEYFEKFDKKFSLVDDRGINNTKALLDIISFLADKTKEAEDNVQDLHDAETERSIVSALGHSAELDALNEKENAIARIILALEEEGKVRQSLLTAEIAADISSARSAEAAFNAIRITILDQIAAYLALTIAKSIASAASLGPLAIAAIPIAAALASQLFQQLVPSFSHGVTGFGGGLAVVGEKGPELVTLGRGSNVLTNENTQAVLGGGDSMVVAELKALRREMRELQVFVNWDDFQRAQQQNALLARRTGRT